MQRTCQPCSILVVATARAADIAGNVVFTFVLVIGEERVVVIIVIIFEVDIVIGVVVTRPIDIRRAGAFLAGGRLVIIGFFQRGVWHLCRTDPEADISWWRMQRMRVRDSRLRLLPTYRQLIGTSTLSYLRPGYSPEDVGSTAQAVAYLASSPAARAAHL